MTKNLFYTLSIAVAAVAMTACSNENDETIAPDIEKPSENPSAATGTWQVTINAGPAETRAISVGGNSGKALYTNWDTGDEVQVLKGGTVVGTLTATASTGNSAYAVLTGTLTGSFAVDDELTLYYHSADYDYSEQVGTLAGVSTNKSYLKATSTVTAINVESSDISSSGSGKLTMSDAAFTAEQAYMDISFTDDLGNPYDITQLDIWASKLVSSKSIANNVTNYASSLSNPVTVTPSSATNHFFLALRDENGSSNTYNFRVKTADDVLFYSQDLNLENGHYYTASSPKVLYQRPNIDVSDGIPHDHNGRYCHIGDQPGETEGTTSVKVTVRGKSRGYYIDLWNPATVTLDGVDASLKDNEFLYGVNTSAAATYVYDIQGDNRIYTTGDYAIYGENLENQSTTPAVKLKGNGTLTVTSGNHDYCGIFASNYKPANDNAIHNYWSTTNEIDVTTQLAANGYTVTRSARIDNADGTYTWKYTVKAN